MCAAGDHVGGLQRREPEEFSVEAGEVVEVPPSRLGGHLAAMTPRPRTPTSAVGARRCRHALDEHGPVLRQGVGARETPPMPTMACRGCPGMRHPAGGGSAAGALTGSGLASTSRCASAWMVGLIRDGGRADPEVLHSRTGSPRHGRKTEFSMAGVGDFLRRQAGDLHHPARSTREAARRSSSQGSGSHSLRVFLFHLQSSTVFFVRDAIGCVDPFVTFTWLSQWEIRTRTGRTSESRGGRSCLRMNAGSRSARRSGCRRG